MEDQCLGAPQVDPSESVSSAPHGCCCGCHCCLLLHDVKGAPTTDRRGTGGGAMASHYVGSLVQPELGHKQSTVLEYLE